MRANMLDTAKPNPVISAYVHHRRLSLRWGGKHAIHGLLTEHEPERLPPEECGAGRKIGPFSLRLNGVRDRNHLIGIHPSSCSGRMALRIVLLITSIEMQSQR